MTVLRIEHKVPNYDGWKKAFDSDPVNRKQSGVRRYSIFRQADDPNSVMIDLEFDDKKRAETTQKELHKLWSSMKADFITPPQTRILNPIEQSKIS